MILKFNKIKTTFSHSESKSKQPTVNKHVRLYSSGNGGGKLGFDSVGMIFRLLYLLLRFFNYSCHVLGRGMTVEVRTYFAGSLLI